MKLGAVELADLRQGSAAVTGADDVAALTVHSSSATFTGTLNPASLQSTQLADLQGLMGMRSRHPMKSDDSRIQLRPGMLVMLLSLKIVSPSECVAAR